MRLPIQYALTAPDRLPSPARQAAPEAWGPIEFAPLDEARYPAYRVVRDAAAAGGNRGAILNAADEVAVAAFLGGTIAFPRIAEVIASAVTRWGDDTEPALEAITALDAEVRSALATELGVH
jgi:1-deoxy-D-xylulose-5-phosphate reductoisomerase